MVLGEMDKFIIHYVGNKSQGDGVRFSTNTTDFANAEEHLKFLISNSFQSTEIYHFHFSPNIELNPVFQFVSSIFENNSSFVEQSRNCARYLYDKSDHPKIKGGELHVAYFRECIINGKRTDAICFLKSENKETFLKILHAKDGFDIDSDEGININKLDKGCLIFNSEKKNGYIVTVVDNTNRGIEAQYWKDDFLKVKPASDSYHFTKDFLSVTKDFVTKQLPEEFEVSKSEQIDLLNRSVDYFKSREEFDKKEFESEVLQDTGIIKSFRKFNESFKDENEVYLSDNFTISNQAVKKQSRIFKSVLKLDKNFHVYIHGNKDMIERGYDEQKHLNYYKIYFREEF